LAEKGTYEQCLEMAKNAITSGAGLQTFAKMVEAQGGDPEWIYHPELFPTAKYSYVVTAKESGYIASVDTEGYGVASLLLGAGRNTKEDVIDPTAGIILKAKTGDFVSVGDPIAVLYSGKEIGFAASEQRLLAATNISQEKPEAIPLVLDVVE
jgi:pyrimidine-nucleoside phosphorylase